MLTRTQIDVNPDSDNRGYLGSTATSLDAELAAIAIALGREEATSMALLSDCRAAVDICLALRKGAPPGSGIEKSIKEALLSSHKDHKDTSISWIWGHTGIEGNSKSDLLADLHRDIGCFALPPQPTSITPNGLRAISRADRNTERDLPGFGVGAQWNRQAHSAYTWLPTNKGPQADWLHKIGRKDNNACLCGHQPQDGHHIVFQCRTHTIQRAQLLQFCKDWSALDQKV